MTTIIKGKDVRIYLGDDVIGRAKTMSLKIDNSVDSTYEVGSRDPCDIKEGNAKYSGTLERPMLNGTLFAHAIGYQTESEGVYTLTKDQYCFPDTTVTGESMGVGAQVHKTVGAPIIKGTLVIDKDGTEWTGVEGTDYVVDYATGLITFASELEEAAWDCDYHYGRSFTIQVVLEPSEFQRTDYVVSGILFSTHTLTLNTSDTTLESLEFTASGMYALSTGEPDGGI